MLIFIDAEFTCFVQMDLISIALVSEDEREFYAERTDYRHDDSTDFVRAAVEPMLGRVPGVACTHDQLTLRLREWFEALPEPATLLFDYFADWELLCDACLGDDFDAPPANVGDKVLLGQEIINSSIFQRALNRTFTQEWPRHHALADARALRAGYRAWKRADERRLDDSTMILLSEYPVLAEIARARTAAVRLDARACRHLYQEWLSCNAGVALDEAERSLTAQLGI